MYNTDMKKRTTVILDSDLLTEAAEVLGTKKTTETIRRSMEEVVRRERLETLFQWDFQDLTPDALAEMRKPKHTDF